VINLDDNSEKMLKPETRLKRSGRRMVIARLAFETKSICLRQWMAAGQ
jgi:hypothetical protein